MAKYLRIPAALQTTATNGDFLLDADNVINIVPSGNTNDLLIRLNRSADSILTLTFSSNDADRVTQEFVSNAICAASRGEKGATPFNLQPLPGGRTINTLAFSA